MKKLFCGLVAGFAASLSVAQDTGATKHVVVLHAARMLDVAAGKIALPRSCVNAISVKTPPTIEAVT
ncbi:hypothetical protein RBB75_01575 [Tunturibacter empetritectus]|uniref:Uncharacterized protein n=1 Tax=Tunturiibacter empetritectus TaxID=3069691 RepID=A0AAU7ZDA8_9BACT